MAFTYKGFQLNDNERTVVNPVWAQMDIKSATTFLSVDNKKGIDEILGAKYHNYKYMDFVVSYTGDDISLTVPPIGVVVDSQLNYSSQDSVLKPNQVTYIPFSHNQRYWIKLADPALSLVHNTQAYVTKNGLLTNVAKDNFILTNGYFMEDAVDYQIKKQGSDNCVVGLVEFRFTYQAPATKA